MSQFLALDLSVCVCYHALVCACACLHRDFGLRCN